MVITSTSGGIDSYASILVSFMRDWQSVQGYPVADHIMDMPELTVTFITQCYKCSG